MPKAAGERPHVPWHGSGAGRSPLSSLENRAVAVVAMPRPRRTDRRPIIFSCLLPSFGLKLSTVGRILFERKCGNGNWSMDLRRMLLFYKHTKLSCSRAKSRRFGSCCAFRAPTTQSRL
jgi:hypothetical protein